MKKTLFVVTIQTKGAYMDALITRFSKVRSVAVVGATDNPEKFGYKVLHKLIDSGKKVFPVHPVKKEIDGIAVYASIAEINEPIDAISLIVNPTAGMQAVQQAYEKGIRLVWCQPGAESDALIAWCISHDVDCIHNRCVLVDL